MNQSLRLCLSLLCTSAMALAGTAAEESVAFLGVAHAPAPRLLSEKLGLPAGQGMVVLDVLDDSPAETVLRSNDVLVSIDGQRLTDHGQLATAVRSHRPGDEVTLVYMREGKEAVAKVKLSRANPALPAVQPRFELTNLAVEEKLAAQFTSQEAAMAAQGWRPLQDSATYKPGDTRTTLAHSSGSIEVVRAGGKTTVLARNLAGAVTFSGPFNTDAEQLAAPASVQALVEWTK